MLKYALALALVAAPGTAFAQAAADQPPVLVEIAAAGQVVVPAKRFRFEVKLTAKGADEDAAGKALATKRAALVQKLGSLSVREALPETGMTSGAPASLVSLISSMGGRRKPTFSSSDLLSDETSAETPQSTAAETVTFDAPSRTAVGNAREAIEGIEDASMDDDVIALLDDYVGPTRKAKADAIAKAREEANAYAASLGLRRAVIVKVSERQDLVAGTMAFVTQLIGMFAPKADAESDNIPVQASLMVEFQLTR
jgi:uncharacterized protein YggE